MLSPHLARDVGKLRQTSSMMRCVPIGFAQPRAVAAPLNGTSVRNVSVTVGSFDDPSVVAKKFRIERLAS
jgi:hypothetical protein